MAQDDTASEVDAAEGEASEAKTRAPTLQRKALVDAVTAASGVKKQSVKQVVDAVLAEIGTALAAGHSLNLPPLGRVAVNRSKGNDKTDILILKLRRSKGGAAAAAGEEDGDDASE